LPSVQRHSVPIAEPNPRLPLESPFRARPGDSSPFRKVVVASWSHFCGVATAQ
jgi:hypothetical protein